MCDRRPFDVILWWRYRDRESAPTCLFLTFFFFLFVQRLHNAIRCSPPPAKKIHSELTCLRHYVCIPTSTYTVSFFAYHFYAMRRSMCFDKVHSISSSAREIHSTLNIVFVNFLNLFAENICKSIFPLISQRASFRRADVTIR